MSYEILSVQIQDEILNTFVRYNLDGTIIDTVVSHFQPQNKEAVLQNLEARENSERQRIIAIQKNSQIKAELEA